MAVLRRKCDQIVEKLGLSYSNTRELNNIIDKKLPGRPPFKCREVVVDGQAFDVYFRDVIACVHGLFGDPEFSQHLKTAPERHYLDPDKTIRRFGEMHTANWWWSTQVHIIITLTDCLPESLS